MATTFESLFEALGSEWWKAKMTSAQELQRLINVDIAASLERLHESRQLALLHQPAFQPTPDTEVASRLREEALRTRATQDRRLAAHFSQQCDELMQRNQELTSVIERYRNENASLLRKVIAFVESQSDNRARCSSKLVRDFHRLTAIWKMDTIHMSDVREKCSHPAYQQIIALGESALPLIFEELEIDPDDWFAALRAITGVNPIASRLKFEEITHAWLSWAKSHGYYRCDPDEEGFSEPQLADVRG